MVFVAGAVVGDAADADDVRLGGVQDELKRLGEKVEKLASERVALAPADLAAIESAEPVGVEKTYENYHRNSHCQERATEINWRVDATDRWMIEQESVSVRTTTLSTNSAYTGVDVDSNGRGFTIRGIVANNGECVSLLGNTVARDARGALGIRATYTEVRNDP